MLNITGSYVKPNLFMRNTHLLLLSGKNSTTTKEWTLNTENPPQDNKKNNNV